MLNFFKKEKIITVYEVPTSVEGDPYIRIPRVEDKDPKTMRIDRETGAYITLWEEKMRYPYKTKVASELHIITNEHEYVMHLHLVDGGFMWNGGNILKCLWSLIGISRHSPEMLQASKWHDILIQEKNDYYKEFKKFSPSMTTRQYRRMTSLIFRQLLINNGVGRIKASIMSWFVDQWQKLRFIVLPIR